MDRPLSTEMRYLVAQVAINVLAEPDSSTMMDTLRGYYPTATDRELADLIPMVVKGLDYYGDLIDQRRQKQIANGIAQEPREDTGG